MLTGPQRAQGVAWRRPVSGIKLFGDGASLSVFSKLYDEGRADGFSTATSQMFRAGIADYAGFARQLLLLIPDLAVCFEVLADDFGEMERQARLIQGWGNNVFVKLPVVNSDGLSTLPLIRRLSDEGIKLNVTALLTVPQVAETVRALNGDVPSIVSILAGTIADTGRDPVPVVSAAVALAALKAQVEIAWDGAREVLNIHQARACGCQIVTAGADLLKRLDLAGRDLGELTIETVSRSRRDAAEAGYSL